MNLEKTKKYYKNLNENDLCTCGYCKNYRANIKKSYLKLSDELLKMGVDIEKPFETNPLEVQNGKLEYLSVNYIIFGDKEDFYSRKIGKVYIDLAKDYPDTGINDKHFVIEIYPIVLNYTKNKERI